MLQQRAVYELSMHERRKRATGYMRRLELSCDFKELMESSAGVYNGDCKAVMPKEVYCHIYDVSSSYQNFPASKLTTILDRRIRTRRSERRLGYFRLTCVQKG